MNPTQNLFHAGNLPSDPDLVRAVDHALDLAVARTPGLARSPEMVGHFARVLARNPDFLHNAGPAPDLARELDRAFESSPDFARAWKRALAREAEARPVHVATGVPPSAVSRRLTAWALRMLPAGDRPEYAELFRSELFDLVLSGGGRRAQLVYALRVLVRAPVLRRVLRAPAAGERSW